MNATCDMRRFPGAASYRATGAILVGLILAVSLVSCGGENAPATEPNRSESVSPHVHLEAPKSRGDRAQTAAITAQAVATIIVIGLGGVFAWRRGYLFRLGQPYVTIDHAITHRQVSNRYVHLEITAFVHNTSRVKVEFRNALFIVQQLAPASDAYIFHLHGKADDQRPRVYRPLEWENLMEIPRVWNKDELVVEPGASAAVTFEYVLANENQCVSITTHFYNCKVMGEIPADVNHREAKNRKRLGIWEVSGTKGWNRTTTYDIIGTLSQASG